ncbi:hypothetical protein, partial [Streptomyces sp. NPDC007355]|uniref:hypothetical protein n=1 Tax=Streptomyces sp. NPDC007355 TaxID=3364778 RepID=UPI0036943593
TEAQTCGGADQSLCITGTAPTPTTSDQTGYKTPFTQQQINNMPAGTSSIAGLQNSGTVIGNYLINGINDIANWWTTKDGEASVMDSHPLMAGQEMQGPDGETLTQPYTNGDVVSSAVSLAGGAIAGTGIWGGTAAGASDLFDAINFTLGIISNTRGTMKMAGPFPHPGPALVEIEGKLTGNTFSANGEKFNCYMHCSSDGFINGTIEAAKGSPVKGHQLFAETVKAFGDRAKGFEAGWFQGSYGTNINMVNELTAAGIPLEEAVSQTWSARQAAKYGWTQASVMSYIGSRGNYDEMIVRFFKPTVK